MLLILSGIDTRRFEPSDLSFRKPDTMRRSLNSVSQRVRVVSSAASSVLQPGTAAIDAISSSNMVGVNTSRTGMSCAPPCTRLGDEQAQQVA